MRFLVVLALAACGSASKPEPIVPVTAPDPIAKPVEPNPVEPAPPERAWPATKTGDTVDRLHGVAVKDPYRWLEDEKSADVQTWMTAQDTYARGELAKLPNRDVLAARFAKLMYYDAVYAPVLRKGRWFYARKHADKEKTVVYWKPGEKAAEQVLFDPNTWSTDGTKGLGAWVPSWDGKYVAFGEKQNNSDESVTYVIEPATGKRLADRLEGTKYGGVSWSPDGKGFYYTWVPPVGGEVSVADRPGLQTLRYHKLGTPQSADPTIYPPTKNPRWFLSGGISEDGHWLWARIGHGWTSADLYFKDARKPNAEWIPLAVGIDAMFEVQIWRDKLYVKTNDGATRYRLFKVDPKQPGREKWKEIVPESDATLLGAKVVGDHLALNYLRNATSALAIHDLEGKLVRKVELPGLGAASGIAGNSGEDRGYFTFTTFAHPMVVYETSIKTGKVKEYARVQLPIESDAIVTEQVWFPSKDGTKISMFLVYREGTRPTGNTRVWLYGYGGFNSSQLPSFSATRALFVERGGVFALPNLRGGGEYGEDWHRAGMLLKKQNVFDDFIAAAEWLIANKWTTRDKLAISGGSNGGLLVGAAMAQRPDLFEAVICSVPLLDMLRYHLSGSGKTWIEEYGSADDPAQFAALHAYSPYRMVVDSKPARYPALLMDSADHDDRVDPLHARKFAAALQAKQTGEGAILLRIERNAGHGGADLVKQQLERAVDHLVFLESQLK